jgi:acyl-CoA thioesterase I
MIESDMGLHLYRRHFIVAGLTLGFAGLCNAQTKGPTTNTLSRTPTILVLGDSLSAEYGLARGTGWVALMEQRLAREKIAAEVINASISGDTTSGGRARLGALLAQHRPTVVVIELGANDALRGLPLQMTQDNLLVMVQAVQASGAKALLVGMQMPPNYGEDYAKRFADTYTAAARIAKVPLVPFLLKGVADMPDALRLFQSDRIHPTAAAHPTMLNNVWPAVLKLLK